MRQSFTFESLIEQARALPAKGLCRADAIGDPVYLAGTMTTTANIRFREDKRESGKPAAQAVVHAYHPAAIRRHRGTLRGCRRQGTALGFTRTTSSIRPRRIEKIPTGTELPAWRAFA